MEKNERKNQNNDKDIRKQSDINISYKENFGREADVNSRRNEL
jgi:hypothetical protein